MIDFRYHLVSIVAVFLALGLGILLGSTALRPSVLSGLEKAASSERAKNAQLYANQQQLNHELASSEQFAKSAAPTLLARLLAGERVVLVVAPGASGSVVGGITGALAEADATVSGQVQLKRTFLDASSSTQSQLQQLAGQLAPPGLTLRGGTPLAQASQVLASAVLTRDGVEAPAAGVADTAAATVLNGFAAEGFLTVSGHPDARATLAVVVTPASPPSTSDSNAASQALVTLAQQLNLTGSGTVVAGQATGSGLGSAIDIMRAGGRGGTVSTVDDAGTEIGQIVVAQALAGQLDGTYGNYGTAPTANHAGPSPAPTPSASPSTAQGATATTSPSRQPASSPSPTAPGKP